MAETKTSSFDPKSNSRGYLWRKESYCDLWRYHDFYFMETEGHPYNDKLPEIIHVQDTTEDLERYYEILFDILNLNTHKRTKYDAVSIIRRVKGRVPDLGIEVIEVTDFYHCGELTSGLFIYRVDFNSPCYHAEFEIGDVIIKMQRPEVEVTPSSQWSRNKFDVTQSKENGEYKVNTIPKGYKFYPINNVDDMINFFKLIRNNEKVIFTVVRDGVQKDIVMNVPFKTTVQKRADVPRIVVKTIPLFRLKDGYLQMKYDEIRNITNKKASDNMNQLYLKLKADIQDGNIVMEIPDTLIDVKFEIDKDGNLVTRYY